MLRFHENSSYAECLIETYEYLLPRLSNLLGYPTKLVAFSVSQSPGTMTRHDADGSLLIRLPGPKGTIGRTYLHLDAAAASDPFCKAIAAKFVAICIYITKNTKKQWDIKALLIREEQFLWDNAILSMLYGGNQKYNVLDYIGTAREVSIFRYEGEPVRLGVVASLNWYLLRPQLQKAEFVIVPFKRTFDLRTTLRQDKAANLLADGIGSFYIINSRGHVFSWISAPNAKADEMLPEWETVPRAYRPVRRLLIGRDTIIAVDRHGEILLFSRNNVLKWNRFGWHRVAGPPPSKVLADYIPKLVAERVIEAAVLLSEQRKGALFIFSPNPEALLGKTQGRFRTDKIFKVDQVAMATLIRLASIDGAVLIDNEGYVLEVGVIIKVPESAEADGQGARTAAAAFASNGGAAIKVSHDGPISMYIGGREMRRIG